MRARDFKKLLKMLKHAQPVHARAALRHPVATFSYAATAMCLMLPQDSDVRALLLYFHSARPFYIRAGAPSRAPPPQTPSSWRRDVSRHQSNCIWKRLRVCRSASSYGYQST